MRRSLLGCDEVILPAARTFLDDFAEFLHGHRILDQFGGFPDPRARGRILALVFDGTLLSLPLFRFHLAEIAGVLVRSPFIRCLVGFTVRRLPRGLTRAPVRIPSPPRRWATFAWRFLRRPCSRSNSPSGATSSGGLPRCFGTASPRWIA